MIFGWKEEKKKKKREIITMLCQVLSSLRLNLSIIISPINLNYLHESSVYFFLVTSSHNNN